MYNVVDQVCFLNGFRGFHFLPMEEVKNIETVDDKPITIHEDHSIICSDKPGTLKHPETESQKYAPQALGVIDHPGTHPNCATAA